MLESFDFEEEKTRLSLSIEQSKNMLRNRNVSNDKINTQRAYRLIKRDEQIHESNKKWWANLKQLDN